MVSNKVLKRPLVILACVFFVLPTQSFAQEGFTARKVEARIVEIRSSELLDGGVSQYVFTAQTVYEETFVVDTADSFVAGVGFRLHAGDLVDLRVIDVEGGTEVYLDDLHRQTGVWWIIGFFAGVTLLVGLLRGLLSLVGLMVTIAILIGGLFPLILTGADPILATVAASAVILGVNMHLAHGLKRQTFLAFLSTLGGLALVLIFTHVFLAVARLSGLASEDGALLFWELDPVQVPVGILAAGIILGAVGVLDDIAITQSEIVSELLLANPHVTRKELFQKAMRVGRHHIASAVNTLILVYAGASLPAFLLFMNQFGSTQEFLQNEIVAEEVVRTLAGTSALVLLVPLSTWLATLNHRVVDRGTKHA